MKCKICQDTRFKCLCLCGFCTQCINRCGHSVCIEIEKQNKERRLKEIKKKDEVRG